MKNFFEMASLKLVKKITVLFLICVMIHLIKGIRMDSETEANVSSNARIVYDQRQNGRYNIHVVIKDVAIIEMGQNEVSDQNYDDDDYYYDEDDLTVKPLKPTVPSIKPSNFTSTPAPLSIISSTESITTTSSPSHDIITPPLSPLLDALIPTTTTYNIIEDNEHSISNIPAVNIVSRSKIEPIYAFEEQTLHSKDHSPNFNYDAQPEARSMQATYQLKDNAKTFTNSKIYKLKMHRSHQSNMPILKTETRRCRSHQYRDSKYNYHGKRSLVGSTLKHLLSMLATLPLKREHHYEN